MLACMNIQQVSTLLNIGSKLVNLPITTVETVKKGILKFKHVCCGGQLCLGLPRVPGYPTGTRVNYPGNFLLPAATRVPEQKQITANVLDINAIFNRIYRIRISNYQILTYHQ